VKGKNRLWPRRSSFAKATEDKVQPPAEPEEFEEKLKKKGRIQKLEPKVHRIAEEKGRSLKELWRKIIEKSKKLKE
jgi:hypothetical protein